MEFKDLLNKYIDILEVSAKTLSEESHLDPALISKYRTGKRVPNINSDTLVSLANAIEEIAKEKDIQLDNVLKSFNDLLLAESVHSTNFTKRFNELINELNINLRSLSQYLNYDISYLYRIKNGERTPRNLNEFINNFSMYLLKNIDHKLLINKTGLTEEELSFQLSHWLVSDEDEISNSMLPFLNKMDEFDLDDYMEAIHFNDLKIPHIPFQLPASKYYYGIKDMRNAELDFFKYTVLNKSNEPIFMYSTMPMEEMAEDIDFNKKWMFGIAMALRKGLNINIIHHLDRPFNELMLGLEAWIPIYMTGLVNPYYMPAFNTDIFHSINYVSGNIMLHGECVDGHYKDGRYYVSTSKQDVRYAKDLAKGLLDKAKPLMSVYNINKKQEFISYMSHTDDIKSRHDLVSSLPLETMDEGLLKEILDYNNVKEEDVHLILDYYHKVKEHFDCFIKNNGKYHLSFTMPSREDYENKAIYVDLSGIYLDYTITYTYEQLERHYNNIKNRYSIVSNDDYAFRNITIQIINNDTVIVSKIKSPVIHFVIKHPTLVDAINHMITIVKE